MWQLDRAATRISYGSTAASTAHLPTTCGEADAEITVPPSKLTSAPSLIGGNTRGSPDTYGHQHHPNSGSVLTPSQKHVPVIAIDRVALESGFISNGSSINTAASVGSIYSTYSGQTSIANFGFVAMYSTGYPVLE
jgi:hypothetical protein